MKATVIAIFAAALLAANANLVAGEPDKPLLEIFEPVMKNIEVSEFTFDEKRPVLSIRAIRELRLARDDKGVMIGLKPDDAKAFEDITRRFEGAWIVIRVADGPSQMIPIKGAITNGSIGFKYPESAQMAEHLRRRFHLAEFR